MDRKHSNVRRRLARRCRAAVLSVPPLHPDRIRDPDRNVIELDAYAGHEPDTRRGRDEGAGYGAHP